MTIRFAIPGTIRNCLTIAARRAPDIHAGQENDERRRLTDLGFSSDKPPPQSNPLRINHRILHTLLHPIILLLVQYYEQ
jgi:hypothetical protein